MVFAGRTAKNVGKQMVSESIKGIIDKNKFAEAKLVPEKDKEHWAVILSENASNSIWKWIYGIK